MIKINIEDLDTGKKINETTDGLFTIFKMEQDGEPTCATLLQGGFSDDELILMLEYTVTNLVSNYISLVIEGNVEKVDTVKVTERIYDKVMKTLEEACKSDVIGEVLRDVLNKNVDTSSVETVMKSVQELCPDCEIQAVDIKEMLKQMKNSKDKGDNNE